MNNLYRTNFNYERYDLKDALAFEEVYYSLSFKERWEIKMNYRSFPQYSIPLAYEKMTDEEILEAIKNVKKPWWDKYAKFFGI